ncbi:unnamed protein product [Zymoseptoria tritici ST99CH_1A5]|uniref:Uncharacterized protein n=4 Tax=Zymoseptoria tritici TaxID=1047171 RepID=F9X409_ZYMTI|nr:uncharacterized protein MYCGRDRAFT_91170 [Zymoseptoria tritici IPO323]SMQ48142.1 unnamed protein product [Zymoseptoria tritici ST99CH_3D7]SMR46692.1 unnamed protein product [Zymoseptoria tritici ST99CH_1E4]SMR47931.1 unnamed protein product [Zymoseptoria tritici ST99CH_3D1]SMY21837.1 unnamed protein product [Zymoseptoria tritici ST99CH_1A5]EGP90143.1 hypothetical protein MYCGRDRAFT_91170 [Zymoseptoria tritici IPO323]
MARNFQLFAIIPVLVIATATVLAFLCVFAGNKPGFMESYSIFTLNTTRLGQNAVEKVDNKILSFNITKVITKRDVPAPAQVVVFDAMITPPPELQARQLGDFVNEVKSKADGALDNVEGAISSKASEVGGAIESGVNSVEGLVISKINSAFMSVQTAMTDTINDAYTDTIDELNLKGAYAVYLRSTCSGEYVTPDGKNITIGESAFPPNGTKMDVNRCSQHSSLNPLGLVRVLFYIGIIFAGLSVLLGIWATFCFSRKLAILNAIVALPALGFLGLATVATHGFAVAVSKILNLLTGKLGLETDYGGKWIAMAWAMTILILVDIGLWTILALFGDHLHTPRRNKTAKGLPEHEMKAVHGNGSPPSERFDGSRF